MPLGVFYKFHTPGLHGRYAAFALVRLSEDGWVDCISDLRPTATLTNPNRLSCEVIEIDKQIEPSLHPSVLRQIRPDSNSGGKRFQGLAPSVRTKRAIPRKELRAFVCASCCSCSLACGGGDDDHADEEAPMRSRH